MLDRQSDLRRKPLVTGSSTMPTNPYPTRERRSRDGRMANALLRRSRLDSADRGRNGRRSGAAQGTVVIAERQTAGRGRMGRTWHSPPGVNLYAHDNPAPDDAAGRSAALLSLVAGVAAAEAMETGRAAESSRSNGPTTYGLTDARPAASSPRR